MKRILFVAMLIAVLNLAVIAQDTRKPATVLSHGGDASAQQSSFGWGPAPAACTGCLFYGGDVNPADPNVQGFANGNTLLVPDTQTYGAVTTPKTGHFVTTGIFFNEESTVAPPPPIFDPMTATYDIRVMAKPPGDCGVSLASGSGPMTATMTGRFPFSLAEYTTTVMFGSPLTSASSTTYWLNVSPQCTNSGNPNCSAGEYFVNNTTQKTGSVNGSAQPTGQMLFNSSLFGFTCVNWCDPSLGQNAQQCADLSFGTLGHH